MYVNTLYIFYKYSIYIFINTVNKYMLNKCILERFLPFNSSDFFLNGLPLGTFVNQDAVVFCFFVVVWVFSR